MCVLENETETVAALIHDNKIHASCNNLLNKLSSNLEYLFFFFATSNLEWNISIPRMPSLS